MPSVAHPPPSPSPPRHSTHVKKGATRFEKEVAAAGGKVDEHPNDPKVSCKPSSSFSGHFAPQNVDEADLFRFLSRTSDHGG